MAEAKKTTTTAGASKANEKAGAKNMGAEQWKKILETTRESYMASLKSLTDLQKETEKLISNVTKNSKSLQEDNMKVVKDWMESGVKLREEFKKIAEDNYKKVQSLFSDLKVGNLEFPFKAQFEDMVKKMEENMQKYFSFKF